MQVRAVPHRVGRSATFNRRTRLDGAQVFVRMILRDNKDKASDGLDWLQSC